MKNRKTNLFSTGEDCPVSGCFSFACFEDGSTTTTALGCMLLIHLVAGETFPFHPNGKKAFWVIANIE